MVLTVPHFQAFPGRHFSLFENRSVKISKQILFIGNGMMNYTVFLQKHSFYYNTVELHLQPSSKYRAISATH
jgi:hypothetical protein